MNDDDNVRTVRDPLVRWTGVELAKAVDELAQAVDLLNWRFGFGWRKNSVRFQDHLLLQFPLLGWLTAVTWLTFALQVGESVRADDGPLRAPAFSIQQQGADFWLVRPNGERFFSLGVCCVDQGVARSDFNPDNPSYAAWRHYADANAWSEATSKRLADWGFSTIGGWSDFESLRRRPETNMAFAPVLHMGSTAGVPWWDMWDPKIVERMDQVARDQILPLRDDPRLMGYYSDNELGWWNGTLFKMTLEHARTSGQRQRLIALLRETYRDEWSALLLDFEPSFGTEGWQDLERQGVLFLRPGGNGIRVERRFLELLADRYYWLVHNIIRKYDQRALILGDRYQSFYYPEVAHACAPYVNAVSTNLNANWNDGRFARFFVQTLHELTGKPVLISEFYLAAAENRSGNRNSHGIFPVAATQRERADGFSNTLRDLLDIPCVIGADWFQYYDEPPHGRFDGEDFNFGLVDIHDRPYERLTSAASSGNLTGLKRQPMRARPDASQGVPPAPHNPLAQFEPTLALKQWDRQRGFVPPHSKFPLADLYVCWNPQAIYLGLCAQDVTEEACYRDKIVPESDRAEWVVSLGGSGTNVRSRIGAGLDPVVDEPGVRLVSMSGKNANCRNVAGLEIPAKLFGKDQFKAGDEIEFTSTFLSHCRADRVEWKGKFVVVSSW